MGRARRGHAAKAAELPRVVLFDMDDTIFDHSLTCRAALVALRREHPFLRRVPVGEQFRSYHELLMATHRPVMLGHRRGDEARRERFAALAAQAGRSIGEPEAERLSRTYRDHYQRLRRPVPGAPAALHRIRAKSRIGIVTNNTVAEQTEKIRFLGLEDTVDLLVTSEEVGAAKPDAAIFGVALARAGALPWEAAMVGDSWSDDVEGARAAGIPSLWFNRFRVPRPSSAPVAEFSSFEPPSGILAALRGLHIGRGG